MLLRHFAVVNFRGQDLIFADNVHGPHGSRVHMLVDGEENFHGQQSFAEVIEGVLWRDNEAIGLLSECTFVGNVVIKDRTERSPEESMASIQELLAMFGPEVGDPALGDSVELDCDQPDPEDVL